MKDDLRMDLRRHRAMQISARVAHLLNDLIPDENMYEAQDRLLELFYTTGLWETDDSRMFEGKEPRDEKGWTATELYEYRQRLLTVLQKPIPLFLKDE
jgi:hypothetical protein